MRTICIIIIIFTINITSLMFDVCAQNNVDIEGYEELIEYSAKKSDIDKSYILEYEKHDNDITNDILKRIYNLLTGDLRQTLNASAKILLMCIFAAFLNSILKNSSVSDVSRYCTYIICSYYVLDLYKKASELSYVALKDLSDYIALGIPVYTTTLAACGYTNTATVTNSVFIFVSSILSGILVKFAFPLLFCCGLFTIAGNLSSELDLNSFSKTIFKSVKYIMGLIMTVFGGILTVCGFATATGDGILMRTTKFATTNFVPVVGGCLTEAMNTLVYSTVNLKNTLGLTGLITIITMCIIPVLKCFFINISLKLCSNICRLMADHKLGVVADGICEAITTMLAMVIFTVLIFIIYLAIIISVGDV